MTSDQTPFSRKVRTATKTAAGREALERLPDGVGRYQAKADRRKGVLWADAGYMPDGLKRFRLESREEATAAWRHMTQPDKAILYTSQQLKRIFQRITKAFRQFGVPSELANKRTIAELEVAVEARRKEIEQYRRLTVAADWPTDKQIRLRTGLDDHLELGKHKPAKQPRSPASQVTVRKAGE